MINNICSDLTSFKKFLEETADITIDITNYNIFEGIKFLVLSSQYYSEKYPKSHLKCQVSSTDIKDFTSSFELNNLEFIKK